MQSGLIGSSVELKAVGLALGFSCTERRDHGSDVGASVDQFTGWEKTRWHRSGRPETLEQSRSRHRASGSHGAQSVVRWGLG